MLQNGNVSIVGNVLTVMLEEDDINNIKELGSVGINEKSMFITISNGSITDIRGYVFTAIINPVEANIIMPDTIPPRLIAFNIQ